MTDTTVETNDATLPEFFKDAGDATNDFLAKHGDKLDSAETVDDTDDAAEPDAQADDNSDADLDTESDNATESTPSEEEKAEEREGQLRYKDYTQKTMQLAEEKRQVEQAKKDYLARADQALQLANAGQDPLLSEWMRLGPEGQVKLAQDDPATFTFKKAAVEARVTQLQQMHRDRQEATQQQLKATLAEEGKKLLQAVPAWKDEKVQTKESKEIGQYLLAQGYADTEVNSLYDSRAVLIARKAYLYDQMMAAKQGLNEKKVAPIPTRVVKPSTGEANRDTSSTTKALFDRARKTGRVNDAVAALSAKIARLQQ